MSNSDVVSGCGCGAGFPGHNCHVIQATRANSDPMSWFSATVTALEQEEATVEYDDGSTCRLWRHGGFDERVTVGTSLLRVSIGRWFQLSGATVRTSSALRFAIPVGARPGCPRIALGLGAQESSTT